MKYFLVAFLFIFLTLSAQNNCLEFYGTDDYVDCDNILTNSSPLAEFTIEFWMKLHSTQPYYMGVFGQQTTAYSSDNFSISFYCGDEVNRFGMTGSWSDDESGNPSSFDNRTTMPFGTGVWKHVATTFDGTTMKMYVDGVLIKESNNFSGDSYAGKSLGNTHDFLLGKTFGYGSGVTTHFFDGEIDEFRIWDDARTKTEIRQNMYQELPDASGETNLVAYYKFDETSGITLDDSKGSNDGTLTNMTGNEWQTSPAMFGPKNCLDFDGVDDNVEISGLDPVGLGSVTVETWVYFDAFNGSEDANITNVIRSGNENVCLRIGDGGMPNNMPQFVVTVSGQTKLNANARLSTGEWYHIACAYDGLYMKLYINGKLDNSRMLSGNIASTSETFLLGANPDGSRALDGRMDEVRIWNDARTASEIREDMCRNLTGNEDNLIAYYNFDSSSGTTLQDYSDNDYDGALTNMDGSSDWVASTAFNTWLNTSSSSWSEISNWSLGSKPTLESIGIYSYTGGSVPTFDNGDEAGCGNIVVNMTSDWSLGGYFIVDGNLILESDIDLNGQTIALGSSAYIIEDTGRVYGSSGSITTTRNLSNIDENVAGLGAEITTSANLGSTTITRTHAANSDPASIERRYSISPTTNTGLNATLAFHYNENELNGLTESYLQLFRSTDGGSNWTDSDGSVNTFVNTITLSGIDAFSLWTAMSEDITPPILDTGDPYPSHNYTAGNSAITIAPNAVVTTDNDLENATVSISPIDTDDVLSVTDLPEGLSESWDDNTKILSISGTGFSRLSDSSKQCKILFNSSPVRVPVHVSLILF